MQELENRDGEIWARFGWNEAGRKALMSKEYKYISPAFLHDAEGVVTEIHHIALTNRHNLYELPALNSQLNNSTNNPEKETTMSAIAIILGLAATATESEQVAAIQTLKDQNVALNTQAAEFDPAKFVPMDTHRLVVSARDEAVQKIALNAQKELQVRAETAIDEGIKEARLAPSDRDKYLALCRDEESLSIVKGLCKNASKIIASPPDLDNKNPEQQQGKLDADQLAMCAQMDLTPEEFLAAQ